jgi:hypothetical protein
VKNEIFPLARGDYIIRKYDNQIARVRSIWWDEYEKEFCMNLSIFSKDGNDVGRLSPVCGGPANFEPAITFSTEFYERIDNPSFPISIVLKWVDDGKGNRVAQEVASVNTLPFRQHKRRAKVRAKPGPAPIKGNFDPLMEATALRIAAETVRDMSRNTPTPEIADSLRAKAKEMDDRAETISPRWPN